MLRLASDADFKGPVLRGLLRRRPGLDLVRVQDAGLRTAADAAILEWAATESRILLSHDRRTMRNAAIERVRLGQPMPGLFLMRKGFTIGEWIDAILLVDSCSEQDEWKDQVVY